MSVRSGDDLKRATAYFERIEMDQAEQLCRTILAAAPDHAEAHVLLGRILQATGKLEAAHMEYRAAATADRTCIDAWTLWAGLLHAHGHSDKAALCLREALTYVPRASVLHNDLGLIALELGNVDEAAAHLEQAVALEPSSISALGNLGIARKAQGNIDEAIACYRGALEKAPDMPELHNNLGDALKMQNMDAAIEAFRKALALRPDYPDALDNLGVAYFSKNRLHEALEKFEHARRIKPDFNRAVSHQAMLLFLLGRLAEAWTLHRRRFALAGVKIDPHGRFSQAVWNGESLSGKSLLVWTEQGLGEEILQASMFNDARAAVTHLTVECTPRVFRLFQRSFPDIAFLPRLNPSRASDAAVDADYQIAAGDLGGIFRQDFSAFPRHEGYLAPDTAKVAELRQKYRDGAHKRIVGISWASYNVDLGKEKTLSLLDFGPILRIPNVTFVNLQYQSSPDEVAAVERALGIRILTDETIDPLGDLDGVAAQIAAMDLVISVSNTTVHVAGALNIPVWNIVPAYNASGMWHWFHDVAESPWYPSMKIYRRRERDAASLMAGIAADLQYFAEKSMD